MKNVDKLCSNCGTIKKQSEFYQNANGQIRWCCKPCSKLLARKWAVPNRRKITERNKTMRHKNLKIVRDMKRFYRYGLVQGEYDARVKLQKGKCAICKKKTKLVVDHCHDKKVFRGLLCHLCNTGIGFLQHDPKIIKAALEYLL